MKRKYIGRTVEEVGKTAIDFQSINHIIFGLASYVIIHFISIFILGNADMRGWICLFSLLIAVLWEVYENVVSPEAFFRVWGMDSVENSLMDIVFGGIGIIIGFTISFLPLDEILFDVFIIMLMLIFTMVLYMKITHNRGNS